LNVWSNGKRLAAITTRLSKRSKASRFDFREHPFDRDVRRRNHDNDLTIMMGSPTA
jgi:hypothetical protein